MRYLLSHALLEYVLPVRLTMSRKTRSLTLSAVFTALTIALLYFASIWPTGQLAITAIASFLTAAAVIESDLLYGVYTFVAAAILGFILLPDKNIPFLYAVFFGYYPIIKSLIERLKSVLLQWVLKLAVFFISLTIMWLFMRQLIITTLPLPGNTISAVIIYIIGAAIFILYDYGYSKAIGLYLGRVSKYFKKGNIK